MARVLIGLIVCVIAGTAWAGEDRFQLKNGPGVDKVRADCVACHSLDYIQLNSPFLDRKGWEATVAKMTKAFGAPIPPADVPVLVEYLAVNYGKK